jgi:hypothetical protein
VKLIVAEVLPIEVPSKEELMGFGWANLKPEGATWYPDARVFVRTLPNTPRWIYRKGSINLSQGFY